MQPSHSLWQRAPMIRSIATFVARPLVRAWANAAEREAQRTAHPTGAMQVHADGADADRLLLIGDGPSVSYGVLSHELGLAGHLARRLSARSGRGVDLDLVVSATMTAESCLAAVCEVDLGRYDAAILTVGANEANSFMSERQWSSDLGDLLDRLVEASPASLHLFVIAVPSTISSFAFPRILAPIVDHQIRLINSVSRAMCAARAGVTFVPFDPKSVPFALRHSSKEYDTWAALIAPLMAVELDGATTGVRQAEESNEPERQRSLDRLGIAEHPDPRIDAIVNAAKNIFDSEAAAVTFIDGDRQWVKSLAGAGPIQLVRANSFCDWTIRASELLAIEDASLDERFRGQPNELLGGVRFYAGYPIEAPDGRRVGALCVVGTSPRKLSRQEGALLRDLAIQVQGELWSAVPGSRSRQNPASRTGS
jgi:hypothetical protein